MERDKSKTQEKDKRSTSLMHILTRRSTKVEPHNHVNTISPIIDPPQSSVSAHSSPINQFRQANLRRHSSTQNITTIQDASSPITSANTKKQHSNNRFSHQFSLCCAVDDGKAGTPPVSVRYNSLAQIEVKKNESPVTTKPPSGNDHENGGTTIAMVHKSPEILRKVLPVEQRSPERRQQTSLNHSFDVTAIATPKRNNPTTAEQTKPVFNEYQSSIAMSACRSRLRQKLLPPGCTLTAADFGVEPHFSSPNISAADSTPVVPTDSNRSLSYDILTGVKRPASADSLAKQSLIAAQLLNLIPVERVRERSYVAGRLAVNSLFGPAELDKVLPSREVKIYVGTWNMNGQNPPKLMTDFVLPNSMDFVPDIVVVGTQESCSVRFEWEVSLQETLGPSHLLLHSTNLGTLHLAVFIRRDLIWFCSVPEDASLSVRPGTAFRTKGAVAISFCLFGTSMLFVTSHLTAHQQKVKERVQDVKRIIHALDLPRNLNIRNKNKDVTQNFDNVFWCGDLNFRLSEPREKVLEWIENTKFPLPSHLPNGYLHTDQLKSVLSNGAAFKDFKEANITFPPTYKYDPGTQHFDTSSKQRAPAYTDRILFKFKSLPAGVRRGSNLANLLHPNQLECLAYDSVPSIVTSDHKPVWALFRSPVRPGLDSVPLAAGLFNREVYLEGMKRRLNNTDVGSSSVCSIQ